MKLSLFARTVWTLVLVVIVAMSWLVINKFDFGRLRGAEHYVEQARHALDNKDWAQALAAIQKVEGPARGQPKFLRVLADYLIATRSDPSSLAQFLEKLQGTPYAMAEDDIWLARSYLAGGRPAQARAALERLPAAQRDTLLYQETFIVLLRDEGRTREAVEAENVLFARFASDPGVAVRKAARDMKGTFPEIREAAEKSLWEIAGRSDEHGLVAIRVLTGHTGLTLPQAMRLQHLAEGQPSLTAIERLNIASVLLRLDPERREPILQAQIARFKDGGGETFQHLIAWLAREKEFGKILRLVPRESLVQSVELFPAVAQDLAQRGQWTDLLELVEKGRPMPVSNARAAGWRALATRNLRPADTRAARAHLEEAIAEGIARKDQHALAAAITLAEEWNMLDLALDATLKLAVPEAPNEFALLERCWQLASRLRRAPVLADLAERLAKLRPGSPVLARRNDYLRLLRGEGIEMVGGGAAAAPDASDADLLLQSLKAYRMGDMALAASSLEKIRSTVDMTPGENAVYAGLLAKARGEAARAYQLAEKVRPDLLLAEERVFLDMAL
ncbi:hypothetical protein [Prosthecobacter sp.]